MKTVILKIEGMSCSACQNRVEKYLNKQEGVEASVNLVMASAKIKYDENKVTLEDLDKFIKESGYKSLGIYKEDDEKKDNTKYYLILYALLIIFLMYISSGHMLHLPVIPYLHMLKYPVNYGIALLILTIPFLIFGFDIIKSGLNKLFHKSPNMDTLVSIGVISSMIYSLINLILIINGKTELVEKLYFESSAMIIFFIKLGRFIDKNSKEKTKKAIKELVQITPQSALIKLENGEKEITIDEVKKGDILICKPGMKVAVDGTIIKGTAHLDEAFITGESIPNKKRKGEKVIAGTINIDGYIEYKAEKIGPDSTISEIVKLVIEATNTKAPSEKLADKVSGYFVPGIMLTALLTLIIYIILGYSLNEAIISFVTVLVVACPCALGLATPLALIVSIGKSAKEGILIKESKTLENAYKMDTIVFDKTGTLTYGKLKISKIIPYTNIQEDEILKISSSLESKSNHPISKAFEHTKIYEVSNFKNIEGKGITGKIKNDTYYIGNTKLLKDLNIPNTKKEDIDKYTKLGNIVISLIKNKEIISLICIKDKEREEAKETIKKLIELNKEVIMLSGDNQTTANIVGERLGITKIIANVEPKQKEKYLKKFIKEGKKVIMVGDGINDAPSLTTANLGISMNSGTDIAADSADIILINDDLTKIVDLIKISKKTKKIIKQNLFWAFFYNLCMIPIAIGIFKPFNITLSPMMASIFMTISSLTVVFNSLRLRR